MKLGLIVSTSNQPEALAKIFDAVAAQSMPPAEVLIADDGSGSQTKEKIEAFQKVFPVTHLWQEKAGFRKGRILNQAIARAASEYLVFLDGDSVPHRRFIEDHRALAERGCWVQGRRAFVKEPYVAGFRPDLVLSYAVRGRMTGLGKGFRFPVPFIKRDRSMYGILGCNLGIWRDDLVAINGYDEAFEGWGREDSDLGARLYHLGRERKMVRGRAVIYHLNHPPAPREGLGLNEERLAETLRIRRIACEQGLSKWL